MRRLWMVVLLLLPLGGCHYPWYSVFRTRPETKQVEVERTPDAQPKRKSGKKFRVIIRKAGMVGVPAIQEVARD